MAENAYFVYSVPEIFAPIQGLNIQDAHAVLATKLESFALSAQIAQFIGLVERRDVRAALKLPDGTSATLRDYVTVVGFVLAVDRKWINTNFDLRDRTTPGAGTGRYPHG